MVTNIVKANQPFLIALCMLLSAPSFASGASFPFPLPKGAEAAAIPLGAEESKGPFSVTLPKHNGHRNTESGQLKISGDHRRFVLSVKGPMVGVKRLSEAVVKDQWVVLSTPGEQSSLVARKMLPYGEKWLIAQAEKGHLVVDLVERYVDPADLMPPEDADFEMIGRRLVVPLGLIPPVKGAEIDRGEDFPFLSHFPGMELQSSTSSDKPLEVQERFERRYRNLSLPPPIVTKIYLEPYPVQPIRLLNAYDRALRAAGWSTLDMDQGDVSGRPYLLVNFSGNGRNVWARLEFDTGVMRVKVAEGSPVVK